MLISSKYYQISSLIIISCLLLTSTGETKKKSKRSGFESLPQDCGKFFVPLNKTSRIAGGYEAKWGQFTSFVHIKAADYLSIFSSYRSCGGTILSKRHILTAFHCIVKPYTYEFFKEIHVKPIIRTELIRDAFSYIAISKACPIKGARYLPGGMVSRDLVVLTMDRDLQFDEYTQPACLTAHPLRYNKKVYTIGLGEKDFETASRNLNILPVRREPCPQFDFGYDESILCLNSHKSKYQGKICNGDSGSGSFIHKDGRLVLVGVTSSGAGRCEPKKDVGFFVNLYPLLGEIDAALRRCS